MQRVRDMKQELKETKLWGGGIEERKGVKQGIEVTRLWQRDR